MPWFCAANGLIIHVQNCFSVSFTSSWALLGNIFVKYILTFPKIEMLVISYDSRHFVFRWWKWPKLTFEKMQYLLLNPFSVVSKCYSIAFNLIFRLIYKSKYWLKIYQIVGHSLGETTSPSRTEKGEVRNRKETLCSWEENHWKTIRTNFIILKPRNRQYRDYIPEELPRIYSNYLYLLNEQISPRHIKTLFALRFVAVAYLETYLAKRFGVTFLFVLYVIILLKLCFELWYWTGYFLWFCH